MKRRIVVNDPIPDLSAKTSQGGLFGLGHTYLGSRQVIQITVSGILFGLLALRAKNLRSCMVAHAWADAFGGIIVKGLPYT